jgi:hypothetical protein
MEQKSMTTITSKPAPEEIASWRDKVVKALADCNVLQKEQENIEHKRDVQDEVSIQRKNPLENSTRLMIGPASKSKKPIAQM